MSAGFSSPDEFSESDMFAEAPGASVGTLDDIRSGSDGDRDSGIGYDPQGDVEVEAEIAADRALLEQQLLDAIDDPRQ